MAPIILAHRGASALAPENTAAAFALARSMGADGFECDVHLSGDGVPVVIHDRNLKRLAGLNRRVDSLPWRQLSGLDVGSWFERRFSDQRLLRLQDALKLGGRGFRPLVELKQTTPPRDLALARACAPLLASARAWACSFSARICAALRQCRPRLHVQLVVSPENERQWLMALEAARRLQLQGLAVDYRRLTRLRVARLHQLGLQAGAWTVNRRADYVRLARWGVDVIETDHPGLKSP